jgi:outer membrane receptor for ferrienterochelin and colicins
MNGLKTIAPLVLGIICSAVSAQEKEDTLNGQSGVVVTGQYVPQSLRKSVYQVRVIGRERIAMRNAANVQQVLNNELGFRFSNDLALGTADVQMMGMSGRNVKILLDGVPMVDRGDTRESLNQVDISSVERIEIVEGPMSVSYGSDALAGVINIITRKTGKNNTLNVNAIVQEETVGDEYSFGTGDGSHIQRVNLNWRKSMWGVLGGFSHNEFGGWQGAKEGREKEWKPKEQWLGNIGLGYHTGNFNIYYRLDGLNENILSKGKMGATYKATDQEFLTDRFMHQLQSEWKLNERLRFNSILAYTDYQRKTTTTSIDFTTGQRTLTTGAGEQDISVFNSTVFRTTAQYILSPSVSLQPGVDINLEKASGARITGSPSINDYAFFVSSELKLGNNVNIRPGLRFISNSVYDAPPVIPSLNTKFILGKNTDLRLAYAHGFRSPALRELYFNFFDASHSIRGNPNLKAEESNSFTGSLSWIVLQKNNTRLNTTLSAYYNEFSNLISYGVDPSDPSVFMTVNIDRFKTTGFTLENSFSLGQFQATLGFACIGRFNRLSDDPAYKSSLPGFVWSPELNSNITWNNQKIGLKAGLFYKFNGARPTYELSASGSITTVNLVKTAAFHLADITLDKTLFKYVSMSGGIKNLFDVGRVNNTAVSTGGAHSSGGPVPVGYGRSYFLALNFSLSQK